MLPSNVKSVAEYISPSADIQEKVIHFGPGDSPREDLLRIPLRGRACSDSTVVINVGIENEYPNEHVQYLYVGLADEVASNMFIIVGKKQYDSYPPCYPDAPNVDDTRVSGDVPNTFKIVLIPREKYGYCETAQEGGYLCSGIFDNRVLMDNPFILLRRWGVNENYYLRYLTIEVSGRRC